MSATVIALPQYHLGSGDPNNQNQYSNHFIFKSRGVEVWVLLQFHIAGVLMYSNQRSRAGIRIENTVIQRSGP